MCRMAAADGITHIVATPHANDRYAYDREYLVTLVAELQKRVGPAPELSLGCDFHFSDDNLERLFAEPQRYTIGETNYLLVELSDYSIPPNLAEGFRQLGDRGLTPILTHPERNPLLQKTPQRVLEYADLGCLIQVTASSLTGFWGERPESVARWLLERSAVTRTICGGGCRFCQRLVRWPRRWWEPSVRRRWSRGTRGPSLQESRCHIARGRCWTKGRHKPALDDRDPNELANSGPEFPSSITRSGS
jgi:hypothetical protein